MAANNDSGAGSKSESKPSLNQILSEIIESRTRSMERDVSNQLKQIENDFKAHLRACIDSCESMERLALNSARDRDAARFRLQARIYRQILDNYTLSNSYNQK